MNRSLLELCERYPRLEGCTSTIQQAFDALRGCYEKDGVVYLCGNGGSAADAEHIVGELMKSFAAHRRLSAGMRARLNDDYLAARLEGALRAVALTGQTSLATAFANDVAPDLVFAQQVFGYGRPGDVLWGLSTSGNSRNVLHALKVARAKGMMTLGMTGQDGGAMAALCDVCIRVPETETHKVQELHLPVYHALCLMLEAHFFA
ncbi:MAG: SIS domain-containing protein [Opitutaceae bacterium]|nr:SIS domain-containing protein [Opitutaceae bacterium]